jgi:hypothetical protein
VDWSKGDHALESFYAHVLKMRADHSALLRRDTRSVWKRGDKSIAFVRSIRGSHGAVAVNFDSISRSASSG